MPDVAAPGVVFWVGVAHWQEGRYLDAVERSRAIGTGRPAAISLTRLVQDGAVAEDGDGD